MNPIRSNKSKLEASCKLARIRTLTDKRTSREEDATRGAIMTHTKRCNKVAANLSLAALAILLLAGYHCLANQDVELGFERAEQASHAAPREPRGARAAGDEPECPSTRLAQSLLPAEYAGSPATSGRVGQSRSYCECTADLLGWHLTCFAGSAGQSKAVGRQAAASPSDASQVGGVAPLPDQLHPAFRGHQIQRIQQAAAVANRARPAARIRRAARWMGELMTGVGLNSSSTSLDVLEVEPESLLSKLPVSSTSHEGFGDDAATLAALTTTRPRSDLESADAPARPQSAKKLASLKLAQLRENRKATNSTSQDEGFVSLPSSDTFTTLKQQQQQHQQDNEKVSAANNNINNHLMFQTVPVLFSVKYVRNNMIEIDCDQAAPNYKPAMFQGKFSH